MAKISNKKKPDFEMAVKLRKNGTIITPGTPFEKSQNAEIEGLINRGIFEFIKFNPLQHSGLGNFKSRIVNEVKGKTTDAPYEKSRLVIQAYNDEGKEIILTQSPNIQRASQCLIAALAHSIFRLGNKNLYLRDHQNPSQIDVQALNKRLKWQLDHPERGLKYIPLKLETAKAYVFVNGSFANNSDLSSQIGFIIILANEAENDSNANQTQFEVKGNMIHYSSTKCKMITRSVLASEIYGMVHGVDMTISMGSTLAGILRELNLKPTPIIFCTDSYSLYDCLIKLGTTKEKRLMIDIMAPRQSYERRELAEVRCVNGEDNPAESMTKRVLYTS
ncbi:hypothetical protein K3495_g12838 [Podosphaera aphanis]|nr:hypothetical protein K3495_g12838 [Podosphaera aphanis]